MKSPSKQPGASRCKAEAPPWGAPRPRTPRLSWRSRGFLPTFPRCFHGLGKRKPRRLQIGARNTARLTPAGFDHLPLECARARAQRRRQGWQWAWCFGGGAGHCEGGAGRGGPLGGARVSGVRGGALRRGHGRLPIAHNETALSAGSGAEGKHGEGAQPGQKEAEDRGGGGAE